VETTRVLRVEFPTLVGKEMTETSGEIFLIGLAAKLPIVPLILGRAEFLDSANGLHGLGEIKDEIHDGFAAIHSGRFTHDGKPSTIRPRANATARSAVAPEDLDQPGNM
jgi:hypothetical protein